MNGNVELHYKFSLNKINKMSENIIFHDSIQDLLIETLNLILMDFFKLWDVMYHIKHGDVRAIFNVLKTVNTKSFGVKHYNFVYFTYADLWQV